MSPDSPNTTSEFTVVLDTGLFNDKTTTLDALQGAFGEKLKVVDVGEQTCSNFTDDSWEEVVTLLLSSSRVITV